MRLDEYVRRIMAEKNLSTRKVARQSGYKIRHAYVAEIMNGTAKEPSISALKALAEGLGEPPIEVIRIAAELPEYESWTAKSLAKAMNRIVSSPELTLAVQFLLKQKPQQLASLMTVLQKALKKTR